MRVVLFTFFLSALSILSSAQMVQNYPQRPSQLSEDSTMEKKGFDPSRLVFGGNFSMSFGDFTFINVSPQVGYRFTEMFTAGAGLNYINTGIKFRDVNGNQIYKENYGYAGLNLFGRLFPTNFLFLMAQPEMNYSWGKVDFNNNDQADIKLDTKWVPTLLVGAGLTMGGRSGRGGLMLSIQYDLAQDPRSPYGSNPFVGMGFSF
jgi:hypothetical protein